jgi:hypothetical protein
MIKNRRTPISVACLFSLLSHYLLWSQDIPKEGLKSITPQEMKAHVYFLASDGMKGRNTPSHELDSCAAYIAEEFKSYGLIGIGPEHSYYQTFFVLRSRLSEPNMLELKSSEGVIAYQLKDDFVPLHVTANKKVSDLPVVFAGYGITAPEYNYDDYASIDAKGKVVFIFADEPQVGDTASVFEGRKQTEHGKLRVKVENAVDHGAAGLLIVGNPTRRFRRPPNPWPSLMRNALENAIPLTLEESMDTKIVSVQIGRQLADDLVAGTGKTLEDLFTKIEDSLTPQSFQIAGKTITIETTLGAEKHPTQNVVGFWEGSDPELKKEYLVIGGHYDHVGVNNDSIYNGADDNASGTAGVLEIAEAFAQSKIRPKRSILFMTFAGEEKGLFGSRYYSENPILPLENLVAMLNMDMISRNDSNEVAIIGAPTSSDLKQINEKANESIGMTLAYDQERYFLQSDHYSFYRKDIPVLFYNTKDTPDLHKPSDDPEKIIPEKMAKIGQLVFSTAWVTANRDGRPNFTKVR